MNLNIFRNPFIDAQVGYLVDNFDQAVRNSTEEYWRGVLEKEYQERLDAEYWLGYQNGYNEALDSGVESE